MQGCFLKQEKKRKMIIYIYSFNKKHRRKSAEQKHGLSFAVRQAQV